MRGSPESWTTAVGAYVVVGCWWGDRCRVVELLADGVSHGGWEYFSTLGCGVVVMAGIA